MSGIVYRSYQTSISCYQDRTTEIIFNGFNLKGQIIYIAFWATLMYFFYKDNKSFQYLFYGLFLFLSIVEGGLRFIIFDFTKKKVIGLFDNENQDANQLIIDHMEDDNTYKIKVTDKAGFYMLDKKDFSDGTWTRLVSNLEKIKTVESKDSGI